MSYKETHANAKIDPAGTSVWTGTWADPRFSPPADGGRPQNALTGTMFTVNCCTSTITVPEADGKMRFWRDTTVATQAPGGVATLTDGTLGYEWDSDLDNGFRPAGLFRMSDTVVSEPGVLLDYGSTYGTATAQHALTMYRHQSGALVFGAGTVQWSWGLDSNHDRGSAPASTAMKQATVNLFADMGVQPLTIQAGLITEAASTDTLAPTSAITSPTNGGSVPANTTVTILGTAADNGGGRVGGVEVSVDGGATWHPATGRTSWTYVWQTGPARTVSLFSRAVDDSGNIQQPGNGVSVTVGGTQRHLSVFFVGLQPGAARISGSGRHRCRAWHSLPVRRRGLHHRHPVLQEPAGQRAARRESLDERRHQTGHGELHGRERLRLAGSHARLASRGLGEHHLRRLVPHELGLLLRRRTGISPMAAPTMGLSTRLRTV